MPNAIEQLEALIPKNNQTPAPATPQGGGNAMAELIAMTSGGQQPQEDVETPGVLKGGLRSFFGQGVAMKFGDEIEAFVRSKVNGTKYDDELKTVRDEIKAFRKENPGIDFGAELAGAFTSALIPGGAAVRTGSALARVGKAAAAGAGFGATTGFGGGEGGVENRLTDAAIGGALGGATAGTLNIAGRGIGKLSEAPAVQELATKASQAFRKVHDAGLRIGDNAVLRVRQDLHQRMADTGFLPGMHRELAPLLREADNILGRGRTAITDIQGLQAFAKSLQRKPNIDPHEKKLAGEVVGAFSKLLDDLKPRDIVTVQGLPISKNVKIKGDTLPNVLKELQRGRDLWRRASQGTEIEEMINRATLRAERGQHRGGVAQTLRNEFGKIAENPKKLKRFDKDVQKAIVAIAKGDRTTKVTKLLSQFAPTGVVSTAGSVGLGTVAGGPVGGVALPALGFAARELGERHVKRSADQASRIARGATRTPAKSRPGLRRATTALGLAGAEKTSRTITGNR